VMKPDKRETGRSPGEGCEAAMERARDATLLLSGEEIPRDSWLHAETCPDCRREIEEIQEVDGLLGGAFREARHSISGPSSERMEAVFSGIRERPPEAELLGRVRRSVNRMLLLTFLLLALLVLVPLLRWLITILGQAK
jgi:hypothetical protein